MYTRFPHNQLSEAAYFLQHSALIQSDTTTPVNSTYAVDTAGLKSTTPKQRHHPPQFASLPINRPVTKRLTETALNIKMYIFLIDCSCFIIQVWETIA